MSSRELEKAFIIRQVIEEALRQGAAAERLGIGVRQVKRLVQRWKDDGASGLISGHRDRVSPLRLAPQVKALIAGHLREKYADFGATLAAEKLAELDGIALSKETVRKLQIELGLWQPTLEPGM